MDSISRPVAPGKGLIRNGSNTGASGPMSPSLTPAGKAFRLPWMSPCGWPSMTSGPGTNLRRPRISARSALIWHHSMSDAWPGCRPRRVEMMPLIPCSSNVGAGCETRPLTGDINRLSHWLVSFQTRTRYNIRRSAFSPFSRGPGHGFPEPWGILAPPLAKGGCRRESFRPKYRGLG